MNHAIQACNGAVWVGNDGVFDGGVLGFVDVANPAVVRVEGVYTYGGDFDIAFGKFVAEFGHGTQFGGAHGGEVGGVRKEYAPTVAEVFVEVDGACGGFCGEVWRNVA